MIYKPKQKIMKRVVPVVTLLTALTLASAGCNSAEKEAEWRRKQRQAVKRAQKEHAAMTTRLAQVNTNEPYDSFIADDFGSQAP